MFKLAPKIATSLALSGAMVALFAIPALSETPSSEASPSPEAAARTYPGTNGYIAFTSTAGGSPEIWRMAPLGGSPKQLTSKRSNFSPSWTVDGKSFVFIGIPPSGVQQIFSLTSFGTLRTQITTGQRSFGDPSISPDGKWIVATSWLHPTDHKNLWLIKADGTGMHRFTTFNGDDVNPSFSPDGKKITWSRFRPNGKSDVMIKQTDGTGGKQLTGGPGEDHGPTYLPDGTKICYTHVAGMKRTGQIWCMNPTGSGKNKLTHNPAGTVYDHAIVSPNGKKVAYVREVDAIHKKADIFAVNYPGGGGMDNLTKGRFTPTDFDWAVG